MMIYDKPPFAIVGRKSLGVKRPPTWKARSGRAAARRRLGAVPDLRRRNRHRRRARSPSSPWAFRRASRCSPKARCSGDGLQLHLVLNTMRLGVPEEDMSVMLMADYGVALYGNAIIVNTDFAAEPRRGDGLPATPWPRAGWTRSPIPKPRSPASSRATRRRRGAGIARLQLALEDNVVTDWVKANGMGNIDPDRFANAIEQIAMTYEFTRPRPTRRCISPTSICPTDGSLTMSDGGHPPARTSLGPPPAHSIEGRAGRMENLIEIKGVLTPTPTRPGPLPVLRPGTSASPKAASWPSSAPRAAASPR
jgi:NitT/TauT family transport system substrate-binding protein